jgi:hypothetical protein
VNANGSRWILRQPLSRESESHNSSQDPPVERTANWKRVGLRYVLRYAGSRDSTYLQRLREPPGSCKLLKCLMLGLACYWRRIKSEAQCAGVIGMLFDYDGDEPGGQILSWFKKQLKAIGTLWDEELPLALLTTVYSGIDAFGLLAALPTILYANRTPFNLKTADEVRSK